MQMIGKHDECVDREWVVLARVGDSAAQGRHVIHKQSLPTVKQIDGEEPASTWNETATIVGHEHSLGLQLAADYAFG